MAVDIQLIVEDDWISPLGGFRHHAQMLLAETGLNELLYRAKDITTQSILGRTIIGVSSQSLPSLVLGSGSELLLSYAIIDHSWPLFRLGLTVRTPREGPPILKMVSLVEIQQNEEFSIRRTFRRLLSAEELNYSLNDSTFANLLVHVPIIANSSNQLSNAWVFLASSE